MGRKQNFAAFSYIDMSMVFMIDVQYVDHDGFEVKTQVQLYLLTLLCTLQIQ